MATVISGSTGIDKIQDGTITNADINASAAIVGTKLSTDVGLLIASGAANGGSQSATSASAQTHTVFTFTMPANKTKVVITGSWSSYAHQSNNGWAISHFEYVTNTGNLSAQANNWHGGKHGGAANGYDFHGLHTQDVILTGVSAGATGVTISLRMTPYNSVTAYAYYQLSQFTAIAY